MRSSRPAKHNSHGLLTLSKTPRRDCRRLLGRCILPALDAVVSSTGLVDSVSREADGGGRDRLSFYPVDLSDKAITPARDGHDVPRIAGRFTERPPDHGNLLCQVRFFHEAVRPQELHQLLFRNHPSAVPHKKQQSVIGFRSERYRLAVFKQGVLGSVPPKGAERGG